MINWLLTNRDTKRFNQYLMLIEFLQIFVMTADVGSVKCARLWRMGLMKGWGEGYLLPEPRLKAASCRSRAQSSHHLDTASFHAHYPRKESLELRKGAGKEFKQEQ